VRYIQEEAISKTIVALKMTMRIELSIEVREGARIVVMTAIGDGRGKDKEDEVKRVKRQESEIEKYANRSPREASEEERKSS
jgi:hypothetical protein